MGEVRRPRGRERRPVLVRFVSPYGSPAWMRVERARELLREDLARWELACEVGALTDRMREVGAPRIEHGSR